MCSVTNKTTGKTTEFDENEVLKDFEYYLNTTMKELFKEKGVNYVLQKIDDYINDCVYDDFRPFDCFQDAQFGIILALTGKLIDIQKGVF